MLRLLAWLLMAGNLMVLAWTQGWLSPLVLPPMASEREPERVTQQVRPESITLLSPQAAAEARRAAQSERVADDAAATARSGAGGGAARSTR